MKERLSHFNNIQKFKNICALLIRFRNEQGRLQTSGGSGRLKIWGRLHCNIVCIPQYSFVFPVGNSE